MLEITETELNDLEMIKKRLDKLEITNKEHLDDMLKLNNILSIINLRGSVNREKPSKGF